MTERQPVNLVGLDIGGTTCSAVVARCRDGDLEILDHTTFVTASAPDPEVCLTRLCFLAKELQLRRHMKADAAGISCGGPLDSRRGMILSPPNLPGWDQVDATVRVQDQLGIPVRLENDANAGAVAEWRWGAGRGCQSMAFLTMGTGLGAGLILDGRLYRGACDLAGELGHIRLADEGPVGFGKAGSFEGFCSGGGIGRWAEYRGLKKISARECFALADQGDEQAIALVEAVGKRLGQGLAILVDLLNPERIVIGSIFTRQRERLWPAVKRVLDKEALPAAVNACQIVTAELDESIGLYAACAAAMEGVSDS